VAGDDESAGPYAERSHQRSLSSMPRVRVHPGSTYAAIVRRGGAGRLAALGAWLAPACLGGHAFDAATLLWFLSSHPEAAATTDDELQRRWRVARMRQMVILLVGLAVGAVALWGMHLQATLAVACLVWVIPMLTPVTWVLTRNMRGRVAAVLMTIALGVPLLNLFPIALLVREAKVSGEIAVSWRAVNRVTPHTDGSRTGEKRHARNRNAHR
jgi:hypothetical protein